MSTGVPVVICADCDGIGFVLESCRCTDRGTGLVGGDDTAGKSTSTCAVCGGTGSVPEGCRRCRHAGQRRAQLVLTVANADTGAVASTSVTAGVVAAQQSRYGGWELPLTPLVHELAARIGAHDCAELSWGGRPLGDVNIYLPARWRPDLPAEQRYDIETAAIATQPGPPWRVFVGRATPAPLVDLDARLAHLCHLANQLCLDLVVEVRHGAAAPAWAVRYEVPGGDVPLRQDGAAGDLRAALLATTADRALYGLAERGRSAPAHYLRPIPFDPANSTMLSVDQLERHVIAHCVNPLTGGGTAGAQAIWRNRRWWNTSLRLGGSAEIRTEDSTGQILRRGVARLLRAWEPPRPEWLGEAIPYRRCPDCVPSRRNSCSTCRDSRRIHRSAVVTITDLRSRVIHYAWRAGVETPPATLVAAQPGGKPVVQLTDRFRLARWADVLGVRPEDLTYADGGRSIGQDLRDGIVTLDHPTVDPLLAHLAAHTPGQPGARLIVVAAVPDVPPLAALIRLLLGLDLAIGVTVENHRLNERDPRLVHGESWQIDVGPPGQPVGAACPPGHSTIEAATAACLDHVELALARAVPDDPRQPVPAPRAAQPVQLDDPGPLLRRLGHQHPGRPVTAVFDRAGCRLYLHDPNGTQLLGEGATISAALRSLDRSGQDPTEPRRLIR